MKDDSQLIWEAYAPTSHAIDPRIVQQLRFIPLPKGLDDEGLADYIEHHNDDGVPSYIFINNRTRAIGVIVRKDDYGYVSGLVRDAQEYYNEDL